MSINFRQQLHSGKPLIGTMVTFTTPAVAEVLADVGYDWLFIDAEHGPFETAELAALLQTVGNTTPCVVRVPALDEVSIKKSLDLGAAGIIVPQVNTAEQAEQVVRFSRYAPEGSRGVGLGRAHRYGLKFQEYIERANDEIAVIVQAEHIDAVNNIESIVKVVGIDGVLIGPYDLSASMGKMGQVNDPAVTDAIDHVTKTCREAEIPLGIFGVSADAVKPYVKKGYTLIVAGVDALLLSQSASQMLAEMRG